MTNADAARQTANALHQQAAARNAQRWFAAGYQEALADIAAALAAGGEAAVREWLANNRVSK